MAIPSHYIQELVARNDIYDTISKHVQLKRSGRIYMGSCPFHGEKTPSFAVYPQTQSYYCFGCGAGGDVINFTKEIDGLTYIEAVRQLAQNSGMPLPNEDDGAAKLKSRILQINKLAALYFHHNLNSDAGKLARAYLRDRELTDKTIVNFGIGYASDNWQELTNYLKQQGFTENEITTAYLATRSDKGNVYDVFRDRIIFPIIDLRGNVIAFGGRRMGENGPKYLNSGDTPVFKKSNGLFALNIAKKANKDSFILAEGYMDVISLHQAGFTNAVATLGTALTNSQSKLIADYAKKVIIAYDSDNAGQIATQKAISLFNNEDVEIQVLQMEGAKDPDEFIKKFGKQKFEMLLEGSASAMDFELSKIRVKYDIKNAEQRITYITKACDVLAKLNNPIQQDVYCSQLSQETNVDKAAIKQQLEVAKKRTYRAYDKEKQNKLLKEGSGAKIKIDYKDKSSTLPKVFAQQQIIAAIIRDNKIYNDIKNSLLHTDFTDSLMREAFLAVENLKNNNIQVDFSVLSNNVSQECVKILAQIIARNADIIITKEDINHFIDTMKTSKLLQNEVKDISIYDLDARIKSLKEKKK